MNKPNTGLPKKMNKKVLLVILKHDYGIPDHGFSYEYINFYQGLSHYFSQIKLFDFGPYLRDKKNLQRDLIKVADDYQPDLIFFTLYEEQFDFKTLDYLSKKYLTINWFCDDPWRFENFSQRYCFHFSYVVTTDHFAVPKYQRIGFKNAILSQFATNEILNEFPSKIDYQYDVSFVGGINPYRRWLIEQLKKRGIEVQTFGTGWPNGRIDFNQMNEVFLHSKINLNISNSKNYDVRFVISSYKNFQNFRATVKNREQIKGRHFEIPAFGGFQLTNYVEFLENYFDLSREISVYSGLDPLVDLINYYLAHDKEREAIAFQGYTRVKKDHTYDQRFKKILAQLTLNN